MRKGGPIFSPSCLLRLRSEIILTNVIKHLTYFKSTRVVRIFVMNRGLLQRTSVGLAIGLFVLSVQVLCGLINPTTVIMTKNKGAAGAGRGNMGPGGSILDGGLYSAGIQPTTGTRLPSPRKPLATKRTQRPSPSYSSPTADYMHNPLALSGTKKVSIGPLQFEIARSQKVPILNTMATPYILVLVQVDTRSSPAWLHGDNSGMDGPTEG